MVLDGLTSSLFLFSLSLTQLKMSAASPFMSSISFAIKERGSFCSIESLFDTSSGKFVRAVEAEPRVERVCSGENSGIVTKIPSLVVCRAVAGGTGCSLSPATYVLVSKESKGLSILKSFGTKCTPWIRSLRAILGKI